MCSLCCTENDGEPRMCCNIPRALSLIFRTSYATRAVVRPPELLLQRSGALSYPAAPRLSEAILPDPCGRAVLDGGRPAPVRPLRVADAPHPSPRAAYSPPFCGGYVQCRA